MRSGKRVAVAATIVGLGVVAAFFVAAKEPIEEYWQIHRLKSPDEATRLAAADRLAEMKSLRAVPYLIEAIRAEKREHFETYVAMWDSFKPRRSGSEEHLDFTPLAHALCRIGPESRILIEKAIAREFKAELEANKDGKPIVYDGFCKSMILSEIIEAWGRPDLKIGQVAYASQAP